LISAEKKKRKERKKKKKEKKRKKKEKIWLPNRVLDFFAFPYGAFNPYADRYFFAPELTI